MYHILIKYVEKMCSIYTNIDKEKNIAISSILKYPLQFTKVSKIMKFDYVKVHYLWVTFIFMKNEYNKPVFNYNIHTSDFETITFM